MLDAREAATVAARFGVADVQVRRDHLIAHLLAALASRLAERVVFFGGTALASTHLPDGRLSEDIDLMAVSRRAEVAVDVERALADGVRREYGRLSWQPPLSTVTGASPATLRADDGLLVRVQLLDPTGYPPWPSQRRLLVRRYRDVPPTSLRVLTRAGFAASKTAAWHERRACRDLYDLWGLAVIGALDSEAADVFARLGPTGRPPAPWMFDSAPTLEDWQVQLAGQTRLAVGPADALDSVRRAWATAGA